MRRYLIVLDGGVEVSLDGPFPSHQKRTERARELHKQLRSEHCDNTFGLDINTRGVPRVWSFASSTFEGDSDG